LISKAPSIVEVEVAIEERKSITENLKEKMNTTESDRNKLIHGAENLSLKEKTEMAFNDGVEAVQTTVAAGLDYIADAVKPSKENAIEKNLKQKLNATEKEREEKIKSTECGGDTHPEEKGIGEKIMDKIQGGREKLADALNETIL